jgi:hypothetical protein
MNLRTITILAAAALALTGGSASAKSTAGDHWYIAKGSSCVSSPTGPLAKVSMMMYADGFNTTQVENFILHARIIVHGATLPGQSWWRKWSTTISPSIIGGAQGGATAHKMTLTTLTRLPSTEHDWDLQIKMQWKRLSRVDWNKTLTIHFGADRCPAGGVSLPNEALPSVNGG